MKISLKNEYEKIVQKYIDIFCKKQDSYFEFWVRDDVGGIACFGDVLYFNFMDIKHDIDTKQPSGRIIDWLHESLDSKKWINYKSYCMGLRYDDVEKENKKRQKSV